MEEKRTRNGGPEYLEMLVSGGNSRSVEMYEEKKSREKSIEEQRDAQQRQLGALWAYTQSPLSGCRRRRFTFLQ